MPVTVWRPRFRTVAAASNLVTGSNNADRTSYVSASATPRAGRLYLLWVLNTVATGTAAVPTVSGHGQTWDQVATSLNSTNVRRITLFRALGANPTAGVLTFDFGGQTQLGCGWTCVSVTSPDPSGSNGSGAVVQAKAEEHTTATGASITLDNPLANSRSAMIGGFVHAASEVSVATAPALLLASTNHSAPARGLASCWAPNPSGPTLAMTWATSAISGVIAVEVKAA